MTCAHCGREIALGARFCGNCGAQGSDPAATTVVLPPEDSDALLARLRLVFAGDYDVERELGRGGMAADGRISISDFGVALRAADVSVTAAGTVIGTPHFMSPEQCAGHRARPQSDQYSLGILAYQMLVGALPFESETLAGLMQHHFYTPIPDIHLARDDVPPALVLLVRRAPAKD